MSSVWMIGVVSSPLLAAPTGAGVPLGILMGVCAAVAWGLSDFLMRGVSRSGGSPLRALCGISFAAALGLSCMLPFGNTLERLAQIPASVLGLSVLLGLLLVLANCFLYRAFARGSVSLVAPIANSHAAVTVLISLLAGAQFAFPTLGAIGLICGGVALSSLPPSPPKSHQMQGDPSYSPFSLSITAISITWTPLSLVPTGSSCLSRTSPGAGYRHEAAHPCLLASLAPLAAGVGAFNGDEARLSAIAQQSIAVPYTPIWPSALSSGDRTGDDRIVAQHEGIHVLLPGVAEALMSAILLGVAFWAMQFVAPVVGATATAWMVRTASAATLGIWMSAGWLKSAIHSPHIPFGDAHKLPPPPSRLRPGGVWCRTAITDLKHNWLHLLPIAGVGVLDALATISFGAGVTLTSAVMVATPASLSPVITVALGCVVLRERLNGRRLGGVMMALGGVLVLSAISS